MMNLYMQSARRKILQKEDLVRMLTIWRFKEHRIVFTNGCFDILHRGHLEYLSEAASLGDVLIIGMNSDGSVRNLKGESRPVQDEETRALALAMLPMVKAVVVFSEPTPEELIRLVKPDILVKGGDYREEEIAGAETVRQSGGQVVILPFIKGHSTSKIIEKLRG
ncbi:MAG: D-glycero-beta-D-manno-heptose 1-phosphate adenylyltransferase [Bacteroidales bacterium]